MSTKRNIEAIYPLSPMQQGMLFHTLYEPESGLYFEQFSCKLDGAILFEPFVRAWERVVERHSVLRTSFSWEKLDKILQIVHRKVKLSFDRKDWRHLSLEQQKEQLQAYLVAERQKGFELDNPPLMRFALLQMGDDQYQFVWHHHHLLVDGWSLPLVMKEVLFYYQAYCSGEDPELPLPPPFGRYIRWLGEQDEQAAERYWRSVLGDVTSPTPLVVDRRISNPAEAYATASGVLSAETTAALRDLSQSQQVTLSTLVHAAWALLLHRYSGEEEVLFGSTVSGRPPELPGVEQMVGLFINTLPLRVKVASEMPVAEWLKQLQAQATAMNQYAYSSLMQLQGWSSVPRDLDLFESIVVFENYPAGEALAEATKALGVSEIQALERTNYPLTIVSGPAERLPLRIAYDGHRFDRQTVERMLGHLRTLLEGIATNPQATVAELPLLTSSERNQLLYEWNDTTTDFPSDRTINELFEAQVDQTPDAIAVLDEDGSQLTYLELDRQANQLAHCLIKRGVKPDEIVAIMLDRSPAAIVAIMAVLKAGAAYLPLDPAYPADRIVYALEDANVAVTLSHTSFTEGTPLDVVGELFLLDQASEQMAAEPVTRPARKATADHLAYVIYTSGSTGRPKGTLLEHRGLCNLAVAFASDFGLASERRMLLFFSLAFDGSIPDIFAVLTSGATLVTARQDTLTYGPDLLALLRRLRITHMASPPAVLAALPDAELPDLKLLISAAEQLDVSVAERWSQGRHLVNAYGPTEATVGTSWYFYDPRSSLPGASVPIGLPIPNMRLYVVDDLLRPVPVGVPGELLIGGVGLARGYHDRPDLTGSKFIPDPFTNEWSGRLYRTGDLVRRWPDGRIEFLRRKDNQIKVRGFRIELGEIETQLAAHPTVQRAAVAAHVQGDRKKHLVAYVVPQADQAPSRQVLHRHLKERLPRYMLPSFYVFLDQLPQLPNGKINRAALPEPDGDAPETVEAYVPPRNPAEELIAGVWAQVLGLERVGVNDDFHELGGHSLLATQVVSRLRRTFRIELPLRALFEHPTVASLAVQVEQMVDHRTPMRDLPLVPVERKADMPLSFAQQRLWFLDRLEPENLFYNIPAAVRLEGRLDFGALSEAVVELTRRHEILRTTFVTVDGEPIQRVAPDGDVRLLLADLQSLPASEGEEESQRAIEAEVMKPFDLSTGPLLRLKLLKLADQEHILVVVIHHIIADGWSLANMIHELAALYEAFASGKASPLPELPIQYGDFSYWQRKWLSGEVLEQQLDYWRKQLDGVPPSLELPLDRPRPAVKTWHGAIETFTFAPQLGRDLNKLSRQEGVTLFMTLLAAFQTLLYRYSGQDDVSVGTAVANRNRPEIEPLIGFFVNTLVMRTNLSGRPTFKQLLRQVRETALQAYSHQDLPFEMLVEALQPERDLSNTPLFQVGFALQNTPQDPLTLQGVKWTPLPVDNRTAKYDLTLEMAERPDGLRGYLEYNTDLFDRETIARMIGHLERLLQALVEDPDQPVTDLPLLTQQEEQLMLQEWNDTAVPFPDDDCIHTLFEEQAHRQPDVLALSYHSQTLTYGALNARANQLARYLRDLGMGREQLVGIAMGRSPDTIVGILAALKAGAAYIPLDPTYPPERLRFMIEDGRPAALLTNADEPFLEHLHEPKPAILNVKAVWPMVAGYSADNLEPAVTADDLAYVIYTSGSTGKPKGAMLSHRGLCNLTDVQRRAYDIRAGESRVLQFSPLSFDASVWEIFMALCNGATLVLADQEQLADAQSLMGLLAEERVTTVTLPPSMLAVLPDRPLPALETIIAAGEACSHELVARFAPGRKFFNAYGPTETTVCASMYLCDAADTKAPPIGRPISNFQLYVLDQHLQPVPVGVPGELCVGGVGLSQGYLNCPELTAERFINLPSIGDWQAPDGRPIRLYRTGDLVRYRDDGNIEFLGRIDDQVKIRGVRVELGEIEGALKRHEALQDAAVIANGHSITDQRLVAYVISRNASVPSGNELRSFLRRSLPETMIPSHFVQLEAFPLTPSNKIDRRALPAPESMPAESQKAYVAPRNDTEETLAGLAAELLQVERVGAFDSFFELGGHSLLATQLMTRVHDVFNVTVPLRALFEEPTIAALAAEIDAKIAASNGNIDRVQSLLEQLDQLSDDEVAQLLAQSEPPEIS